MVKAGKRDTASFWNFNVWQYYLYLFLQYVTFILFSHLNFYIYTYSFTQVFYVCVFVCV